MSTATASIIHSPVICLHHSEIFVDDRVRSDPGEYKDLANKLRDEGQQNPITFETVEIDGVTRRKLNTGFRRLAGAAVLESKGEFYGMHLSENNPRRVSGPGYVLCRDIGTLTERERLILELSENDSRKQFADGERAVGYARLKRLIEKEEGRSVRVTELAGIVNESVGQVGMGLKVAEVIERDPTSVLAKKLARSPSVKAAHQTLKADQKLKELRERASKSNIKQDDEIGISYPDGVAFLKSLDASSVDFVHMDLPWGIDYDSYQRRDKHELYDDTAEAAMDLASKILPEAYRVLKDDTWSVFWCGVQFLELWARKLSAIGFKVNPIPNIWFKPNKGGSQSDSTRVETNTYECYLRVAKGEPRLFKKPVTNLISIPMDVADEREHSAQKPIELCREILERYTFGQMFVVDPTYGSGRFFKAAKILGRKFAGAELSESNRERAINLLRRMD